MGDPNFWKDEYEDAWKDGNRRENLVTNILKDNGIEVVEFGFAAGSEEYKEGRPEEYGYEQGDPDLRVEQTDQYIEVTGTDLSIEPRAPIWVRPDKIENARDHADRDEWVVHVLEEHKLFRAIHLTEDVIEYLLKETAERRIYPYINGNEEEYVAISPFESELVEPIEAMINYLTSGFREAGPQSIPESVRGGDLPEMTMDNVSDGEYAHICVKVTKTTDNTHDKIAREVSFEDISGEESKLTIWANSAETIRNYDWDVGNWYYLSSVKGNEFNGMKLNSSSSMKVTPLNKSPI
jgi:hypothetical protein